MVRVNVEVVYATREHQEIIRLTLDQGARAIDAVGASGLLERNCGFDCGFDKRVLRLGIHGAEVAPDAVLADADRVEICRPLKIDPKQARRARARAARS